MQQRFDEWLDSKLDELDWQPADLARASQEPDYPRGFDPGLISRWRKPPPMGVIPRRPTLSRLARALNVSEDEAYTAAGLQPPNRVLESGTASGSHDDLLANMAPFASALKNVPRQFWASVLNASIALASAYADTPISAPQDDASSAPDQNTTGDESDQQQGLSTLYRQPACSGAHSVMRVALDSAALRVGTRPSVAVL